MEKWSRLRMFYYHLDWRLPSAMAQVKFVDANHPGPYWLLHVFVLHQETPPYTACTLLTQFINSSSVFSINSVSNQGQIQVNEMLCDIENQVIKVGLVEYSLISTDHHCQHLIFARTRWCTLSDYNIQQKFTLWGMQESRLPFRMDADFCGDTYLTSKTWTTTLEV